MSEPIYIVTEDTITIPHSYKYSKWKFNKIIKKIKEEYPEREVCIHRKNISLIFEWSFHNFFYNLGILRSHTENVDMQYPLLWYEKVIYTLLGWFFWLFIK